jgi:hypothetical protein
MLAMLMFMGWNASAQTALPYLTSKAQLRAWMVEQAGSVTMHGWCSSQVRPTMSQGMILAENHTAGDIIAFITNTTLSVKEANLNDPVQLYCSVNRRDDGSTLFWGSASGMGSLASNGQYVAVLDKNVPANKLKKLKLGDDNKALAPEQPTQEDVVKSGGSF